MTGQPRPFPIKVFNRDHLIRNREGLPIGRAILGGTYEFKQDRIYCVLMTVPKEYMSEIKGRDFWIDGEKYQIAKDTNSIRFSGNKLEHRVNSFYLERVIENQSEGSRSDSKRVSRKTGIQMAKDTRKRIEDALAFEVEREAGSGE